MDYQEARAAFFQPRAGGPAPVAEWDSPARRLRDAMEPIATICFWSQPAYDEYAGLGLDFLTGYVWSRASPLGEPEGAVVASSFGVFEPGLISTLYQQARETCSLAEVRAAKEAGACTALQGVLGKPEGLAEVVTALRGAVDAVDPTGRPLVAGLSALDWPEDLLGQLWHACTVLREHRGETHLAVCVHAGLDGLASNLLTELRVGWEPLAYTASRGWSAEAMETGLQALRDRGLVEGDALSAEGRRMRDEIEQSTDRLVEPVVAALGGQLDDLLGRLEAWSDSIVTHGWFPPDPYKRASG